MNYAARRTAVFANRAGQWLVGQIALGLLTVLRLLPAEQAVDLAAAVARRVGPLVGRHKVILSNLRLAFPEKSESEITALAIANWDQMGRLAAEYIFLDKLFDFDVALDTGDRIEIDGNWEFVFNAREHKPHILFTGHLGNFELLPVAAVAFNVPLTVLFRMPNNPYIARYIAKRRAGSMESMLQSKPGAAVELARILQDGGNVGVLVDQKFQGGVPTTFFGHPCRTNPLLGKLARLLDVPVYPARCVRLGGNRFRLCIQDELKLPRDAKGKVDIAATAQLLNDVVEGWVREHPAQWMWFHKRWG